MTDAPTIRGYAQADGWDAKPTLMRSESEGAEYPWIATWKKKGALKVATGGNTPDQALAECHRHAARLLGA